MLDARADMNDWEVHLWGLTYASVFAGVLQEEKDTALQDREREILADRFIAKRAHRLADAAVEAWRRQSKKDEAARA